MRLGVHGQQRLVLWQKLITVMSRVILSIQIGNIVGIIALMDYLELISAEKVPIHFIKLALDRTARR